MQSSENSNDFDTTRKPSRRFKIEDLSGRKIGRLTVTSEHESRTRPNSRRFRVWWLCNCECGRSKWVMSQSLRQATIKSCGCLRLLNSKKHRESLIGKTFGSITVVSDHGPDPQRRGGSVFCRCECGTEKVIIVDLFKQQAVSSCGCKSGILPPGRAARNIILARYKRNALTRGKEWDLSDDEALEMMDLNCHYCGSPPANVQGNGSYGRLNGEWAYNGIDRKNNNLGYVSRNVVPACASCNRAKNTMPYAHFMAWIGRLVRYRTSTSSRRISVVDKRNSQLALPQ